MESFKRKKTVWDVKRKKEEWKVAEKDVRSNKKINRKNKIKKEKNNKYK